MAIFNSYVSHYQRVIPSILGASHYHLLPILTILLCRRQASVILGSGGKSPKLKITSVLDSNLQADALAAQAPFFSSSGGKGFQGSAICMAEALGTHAMKACQLPPSEAARVSSNIW
jgi:hypothetical protein